MWACRTLALPCMSPLYYHCRRAVPWLCHVCHLSTTIVGVPYPGSAMYVTSLLPLWARRTLALPCVSPLYYHCGRVVPWLCHVCHVSTTIVGVPYPGSAMYVTSLLPMWACRTLALPCMSRLYYQCGRTVPWLCRPVHLCRRKSGSRDRRSGSTLCEKPPGTWKPASPYWPTPDTPFELKASEE